MLFLPLILFTLILLLAVAFYTLLERQILSEIQWRVGPNNISINGIIQPLADGINLFLNSFLHVNESKPLFFWLAPPLTLTCAFLFWFIFPSNYGTIEIETQFLFLLFCWALSIYGILLIAWSSNSNFSLLGGTRSVIQSISYEIALFFIFFLTIILVWTFNLNTFIFFNQEIFFSLPILLGLYFLIATIETNRSPFDLAEGESELVSGFNIEYGSFEFSFIFLAEYLIIIFFSALIILLISSLTNIHITLIMTTFIIIRSFIPRYRFDQILFLAWNFILPITLSFYFWLCWLI